MNRIVGSLSLLAFAVACACAGVRDGVAFAATPASATSAAPADQYFGPTKMSAIGIRNRIDALGRRYHARTIDDTDLVHDAKLAEDALYAWQRAYPRDPWMVATLFHLEQLYQAVQSPNARTRATALLHVIVEKYPATKQAHASRIRLAQGFPPLHGETATHATPNPYQQEAERSPSPSAASGPSSGTASPASPSPEPSPSPT